MSRWSFLQRLARLLSGALASDSELSRLRLAERELFQAVSDQQAAADGHAEQVRNAADEARVLRFAVVALQTRIEDLEAELYLVRSDQQRSAILADTLRLRIAALLESAR